LRSALRTPKFDVSDTADEGVPLAGAAVGGGVDGDEGAGSGIYDVTMAAGRGARASIGGRAAGGGGGKAVSIAEGGPAGDRGSYASSRRSVGRKVQERLRRALADSTETLIPGLRALLWASGIIVVVTAALGIGVSVYIAGRFSVYRSVTEGAKLASDIVEASVASVRGIRTLLLCNRGWIPCPPDVEAGARSLATTQALRMSVLMRDQYTRAQALGYTTMYDAVNVHEVFVAPGTQPGTVVESLRWTSLFDACLQLVAALNQAAVLPLANVTRGSAPVQFLLSNTLYSYPINTPLNATTVGWVASSEGMADEVYNTSLAIFVCMIVVVVLLGLGVVLPILVVTDRTRDGILLPLVALPAVVASKLAAASERHLRAVRLRDAADAGAEDSDDSQEVDDGDGGGGDDEEAGGGGGLDWAALVGAPADTDPEAVAGAGSTSAAVGVAGGPSRRPLRKRPALATRVHKKSSRTLLELMARFLSPLLLVGIFFAVIFGVTSTRLTQARILQEFDLVSNSRTQAVYESYTAVRAAITALGSPADVAPTIAIARHVLDQLEYHHRVITFIGMPAPHIIQRAADAYPATVGAFSDSELQQMDTVTYGDACTVWVTVPDAGGTYATCAAFRDGALLHGFHSALLDFLTLSRTLLSRRELADVHSIDTGLGNMTLADNTTVPYSIIAEMASPSFGFVEGYAITYLGPLAAAEAQLMADAMVATLTFVTTFLAAFVGTFLGFFLLYQFGVIRPLLHTTNASIKSERLVLLLVPAAVMQASPALQDLAATVLEAAEGQDANAL